MKTKSYIISRLVTVTAVAGAIVLAGDAVAQPTKVEEGPPKGTTSMAGVGAKPRKSEQTTTASPSPAASGGTTAQLSAQDRNFMMNAAKGGMMEVHMGEMATQQGQSPEVKKLGARMVGDHTKANSQLMGLAQARGVKLDTRHKMDKMKSENFDQEWLAQMEKDHAKTIADFQAQSKNGSDPELKSWAAKMLPTLQEHMKLVKGAQAKMTGGATAKKSG
jgi:putative membrane protein